MRTINDIINEYKESDVSKRLFLFLEHPSLRKDFVKIDQHERPKMDKKRGGLFGLGNIFSQFIPKFLE